MEPWTGTIEEERALLWEAERFLFEEAEMLDAGRYDEWLRLLTDDIVYLIPIRSTREKHAEPFSAESWHMKEDRASLQMRVARVYTEYNWAEDPPSRSRRFVTNLRLTRTRRNELITEATIKCNVLLFRGKFDSPSHALLSGEREDVLRREEGVWKLAKRTVRLDHTTIGMSNLALFI